jgi:hypothetical protein
LSDPIEEADHQQQHNGVDPQIYHQGDTCYYENDTDKQADDINMESEPESTGTKCPYCSLITSKTLE